MPTLPDPVLAFVALCYRQFETAIHVAAPDSRFGRARAALGDATLAEVASAAMVRHVRRVLVEEGPATAAALTAEGGAAIRMLVTSVVADTLRDVLARAGVSCAA